MAARKGKKPPPKRAKRSMLGARPSLRIARPQLEPHHVDVIALALIAVGIFLAGVAYLHWAGGTLGDGVVTAFRFILGTLGYAVPAALVAAGALLLMRELRPPVRPMRTGLLCLVAALTLALAGGTLGIGPGAAHGAGYWHASVFEARGGIVGQGELWVVSHLISTLGAHILAVFLFIAGVILVTGAGVAGTIRATGAGVAGTSRAIRRSTEELAATVTRRPATDAGRAAAPMPAGFDAQEPLLPPEPDTSELVVRATHLEAPPIEFDDEPIGAEESEEAGEHDGQLPLEPAQAPEPSVESEDELTPQGRYRASVTDDPDFEWRVPSPRFLVRSTGEA
ncbi:MAG TPA: hypothetical protein VMP89_14550, partial [Solirubrobacteraceae bacterium]|nr:hypothetical protein [Solirubrobacteraceae bacterium]